MSNSFRPDDTTMRIGDHERDQVSAELRAHFTAGRIGVDEFSNRLDDVFHSATAADLADALRDLPPVPGYVRPWDAPATARVPQRSEPPAYRRRPVALTAAYAHLRCYLSVMGFLVFIWAITGFGYFWPIWPMAFWGFFALRHAWWAYRQERRVTSF